MLKRLLPIILSVLLPAFSIDAAVVGIDWGSSDVVTANRSLVLPGHTDYGSVRVWNQTGTTPLTPVGSTYNGVPFYGILQNTASGAGTDFASAIVMQRNGENDRFYVQGSTGSAALSGLVYVKKEDFMGGSNSAAPVKFAADSAISLTLSNLAGNGTSPMRVARIALLDGNQWYVSFTYVSSVTQLTISDLLNSKWMPYTVGSGVLPGASYNAADYNVLGSEFEDIQAVGVYFLNDHLAPGSTGARDFSFNRFSVSFAEPIPEPGSMALLSLAAGAFFVGRQLKGGQRR